MGKGAATGPQAPLYAFSAALNGLLLNAEMLRHAESVLVVLGGRAGMLQLWQVRYVRASVRRALPLAAKMLFSAVPVAKQNKTLVMSIFVPKGLVSGCTNAVKSCLI